MLKIAMLELSAVIEALQHKNALLAAQLQAAHAQLDNPSIKSSTLQPHRR